MMYLRFGIIPVIVGHFVFNACWHSIGYVVGTAENFSFLGRHWSDGAAVFSRALRFYS